MLNLLNECLKIDPIAIKSLMASCRTYCNSKLENHPTLCIKQTKKGPELNLMGLLNGIFLLNDQTKQICLIIDAFGDLCGFCEQPIVIPEIKNKQTVIEMLNECLSIDPLAIDYIVKITVPTNSKIADHPTVVVGEDEGKNTLSIIGIINGWYTTKYPGKRIAYITDDDNKTVGFAEVNIKDLEGLIYPAHDVANK